jgi:hypothetical protein
MSTTAKEEEDALRNAYNSHDVFSTPSSTVMCSAKSSFTSKRSRRLSMSKEEKKERKRMRRKRKKLTEESI